MDERLRTLHERDIGDNQAAFFTPSLPPAAKAIRIGNRDRKSATLELGVTSVLGDVVEKPTPVRSNVPVSTVRQPTGFPVAKRRVTVLKEVIDYENETARKDADRSVGDSAIEAMTRKEIRAAQREIHAKLRPETINFLKKRAQQRTHNQRSKADETSPVRRVRFELDGTVAGFAEADEKPWQALSRDPLREDEGSVPPTGIYTIEEAMTLISSAVHGQRLAAIRLIYHLLIRARSPFLTSTPASRPIDELPFQTISWNDVWTFLLFDMDICTTLRALVKERSISIVQHALAALSILFQWLPAEKEVDDLKWRFPLTSFPVLSATSIQRQQSSKPWRKTEPETRTLLLLLQNQLQTGLITDLTQALTRGTYMAVIPIVSFLAQMGLTSTELIVKKGGILSLLKTLVLENSTPADTCRFLGLVCQLLVTSSGDVKDWALDCLEVISPELSQWREQPLKQKLSGNTTELMETFFRVSRLSLVQNLQFLALEDLFGVYFPQISATPTFLEQTELTSVHLIEEIYLYIATALEKAKTASDPLQRCVTSIRETTLAHLQSAQALSFLESSDEPKWDKLSCLAAVVLFLAYDRSLLPWTENQRDSLRTVIKQLVEMVVSVPRDVDSRSKTSWTTPVAFYGCVIKLLENAAECIEEEERVKFLHVVANQASEWIVDDMDDSCSVSEIGEVLQIQWLAHWANFATLLVQSISNWLPKDTWLRWTVNYALSCVVHFPPGYGANAIDCITTALTSTTSTTITNHVSHLLRESQLDSGYEFGEVQWVTRGTEGTILLDGILATWFDVIPENNLQPEFKIKHRQETTSFYTSIGYNKTPNSIGSRLPLPTDYLFMPLRNVSSWEDRELSSDEELELLREQLLLVVYLESEPSFLTRLSAGRKIKRLIELVFLREGRSGDDRDFWSNGVVQRSIVFLMERYVSVLTKEKDAFTEWDAAFVEQLLAVFVSTGDVLIGSVVALLLLNCSPLRLKLQLLRCLSEQRLLHLLPSRSLWFGTTAAYRPTNQTDLIDAVRSAVKSGALIKADKTDSGIALWARDVLRLATDA